MGRRDQIKELPGCISQGESLEQAAARVREAMVDWLSVALEDERPIPMPGELASHSGRFLVRLPRSLHGDLVYAAEQEGVSLNQFVTNALAGAVHWRGAVTA